MANQSRKHRGYRSQAVVANWFAANGWPFAESVGAGRGGNDVTGVPGLRIEVKARRGFSPLAWLRQVRAGAETWSHGVPFVVFRNDGQGEADVGQWGVLLRLDDMTTLLHEAGYGSPEQKGPDAEGDSQRQGDEEDQEADQGSDGLNEAEDGQRLTKGSKKLGHETQGKP